MKNLTNVKNKYIGVPVTNQEKFDLMKKKNPALEKMRDLFDLGIKL